MTIADQITLCRAILLELQTGTGQPGGPIEVDGYSLDEVNEAMSIMVDERMVVASPPGTVYVHCWSGGRITMRGLDFIHAYRADVDATTSLDTTARSRDRSDTMLEVVGGLAKALRYFMPG